MIYVCDPSNGRLLLYANINWSYCEFSCSFNPIPCSLLKLDFATSTRSNIAYLKGLSIFNICKHNIRVNSSSNFYSPMNSLYLFGFDYYIIRKSEGMYLNIAVITYSDYQNSKWNCNSEYSL